MKYCKNCGAELADDAVVCVKCGCATEEIATANAATAEKKESSTLSLIAKIFMVLGCIATGWSLIPLCWTIPMTVHYWHAIERREPVSTGFKVCALLFVSLIGGVLMLCDKDN